MYDLPNGGPDFSFSQNLIMCPGSEFKYCAKIHSLVMSRGGIDVVQSI